MRPLALCLLLACTRSAAAFQFVAPTVGRTRSQCGRSPNPLLASEVGLQVTKPSDKLMKETGMRDWLPTTIKNQLIETLPDGALRYVESGSGQVSDGSQTKRLTSNTLVTVVGNVGKVVWTLDEGCDELVLLTPEYWTPDRVAARAALPVVTGVLGALGAAAALYVGISG